jgi:hypothetical protein
MHNESGFNPPLSERTYHKPSAFGGSAFPRERNLADPGNDRGARFLDQKGPVRGRAETQSISQILPCAFGLSRVGGPTASRVNLWRLVPGTAWMLVNSGYLGL